MKSNHFFKILNIAILSFIFFTFKIYAIENIDERVKNLTLELRCMTCQNQSIYDSDAEFSNDIKKIVKQKLQEGESERDIKKFLVERYGEYILFRPLMNNYNIFLWSFPFILLIFGVFFVLIKIKRKKV
ncbi:cytochrome c-type biogenesis protein CcmH [Pelagibacteraceae bacterium]|nr:cytochrome c-type biogenesis protein CcmH [Pelagibacteraceae bacterium]